MSQVVKENIDYWRRIECEHLAYEQAADHGNSKWSPQFRTDAASESQRNPTEKSSHGSHHDRAKTKKACLVDGFRGILSGMPFCIQCEINHHDAVFLDDSD